MVFKDTIIFESSLQEGLSLAQKYFNECMTKYFSDCKGYGNPKFEITPSTTAAGLFVWKGETTGNIGSIQIRRDYLENPDHLRSIVFHETIHYALFVKDKLIPLLAGETTTKEIFIRDKYLDPHDNKFKKYMNIINSKEGKDYISITQELNKIIGAVSTKSIKYSIVDVTKLNQDTLQELQGEGKYAKNVVDIESILNEKVKEFYIYVAKDDHGKYLAFWAPSIKSELNAVMIRIAEQKEGFQAKIIKSTYAKFQVFPKLTSRKSKWSYNYAEHMLKDDDYKKFVDDYNSENAKLIWIG